jgi:hypothetical protein
VAYLAAFVWGVSFALGLTLARVAVPRVRARFGPAAGAAAVLLCLALFLVALGIPKSTGLFDDTGWVGVILFAAGMLSVEIPQFRRRAAASALASALARQERFDNSEVFRDEDFFDSPEAAALSGWASVAQAHVLGTNYLSERSAEVYVDTVPSHPVAVICERSHRGWIWTRDVNA